ncbi:hypothetical protein K493DRAFT_341191 [Basidiobolus meristosporus CBS 931.73]|uniref:FAS1 domain-containing protein n=1 Tax=Basidiobolus meristosporus CBS 931.73 TaxID=1314790 RepID=A0A1Y1XS60_9FUNG|nr:hypothetical protein K493DRAFT_341191 [Basidiobolus meristosporus CBS 931.73]|eukprot:ORX88589.1 hypothetical protein K493DRAFT_341191 [Basidiobolus meristosporus CBS 931.73]
MNYFSVYFILSLFPFLLYGLPLSQNQLLKVQETKGYVEVVQDGKVSLGDVIPTDKSLGIFTDALLRFPDLASVVFNPENEVTVLAPVNAAFQKYLIVEHFDDLHEIVASHIISRRVGEENWKEVQLLPTLNHKSPIEVRKEGTQLLLNDKAQFLDGVRMAGNGYLYKIDEVLA